MIPKINFDPTNFSVWPARTNQIQWAVIAGGYPRDIVLEAPVRDVDVFIGVDDICFDSDGYVAFKEIHETFIMSETEVPVRAGLPLSSLVPDCKEYKTYDEQLFKSFTHPNYPALNVILVPSSIYPTAEVMIKTRFQCWASQIWGDVYKKKLSGFNYTKGFESDYRTGCLTFSRSSSEKYMDKLRNKYQGKRIVVMTLTDEEYFV